MNRRNCSIVTGFLFIVVLIVVVVLNLIVPDKESSDRENRMLQKLPSFSLSKYADGRFEKKMTDYFDDQFFLRTPLIKVKTSFDRATGKLESNGVYFGRDHYLIESLTAPDPASLKKIRADLKSFRKKHAKLKMYFMLAPNAGSVLKENVPASVQLNDQDQYMDRFFSSVSSSGYRAVDVRETLKKAAGKKQIFYRTDHHWTTDGAYEAYKYSCGVMKLGKATQYTPLTVKNDFLGTLASKSGYTSGRCDEIRIFQPKSKKHKHSVIFYTDTKKKTTRFYQLDYLKKKDAYAVFGGSNHPMYTIETPVKSKRRLLLIKDSYANCFVPFLTQHFRAIVVVDPRYYFENINKLIKNEQITDVLFLYNANTFFEDRSLSMML